MKRNVFTAAAAALLVFAALLGGCATPAANGSPGNGSDQSLYDEAKPAASAAPAESTSGVASDGALPVVDPGSAAGSGKKVVYTANMAIEAGDASAALEDISSKTVALGGYVSAMKYEESSHTGWITVRVAPEKLKELTQHVGALGKVLTQDMSSQDVTDQYYDVQSRLTNAQAQEAQLLEIMKQAVAIDDILKVRQELNTVQQEIEQLKGQIRLMDNQVGFSTVTISVQQPRPPAVTVDKDAGGVQFWGFEAVGQKIARGASDSFNWTLNAIAALLMGLSYAIVPLALIAIAVLAVIFIVKAAGKRKKRLQQK